MYRIIPIAVAMPLGLGHVNAYLVKCESGCVLIDTGFSRGREQLIHAIAKIPCTPCELSLILLTHGDFDHSGNAAFLSRTFVAPVAMHQKDAETLAHGDMFATRRKPRRMARVASRWLFGFHKDEHMKPDLLLDEGADLSTYGLDAKVIHLPGHSPGSIGVLTSEGDLFCGDLLDNTKTPQSTTLVDDPAALQKSIERVKRLGAQMIYPGHGEPFRPDEMDGDQ